MKKVILSVFLALFSFAFIATASAETITYDPVYITDHAYNLDTGAYIASTYWDCTAKILLNGDNLSLSDDTAHHLLFWDDNNIYIGYYNLAPETTYHGSKWLGDGAPLALPASADRFAIMGHKVNTEEIAVGSYTYQDIFASPIIAAYDDSVLSYDLQTSYETTLGNELIRNPWFADTNADGNIDLWTLQGDTTSSTTAANAAIFTVGDAASQGGVYTASFTGISGNKYYLTSGFTLYNYVSADISLRIQFLKASDYSLLDGYVYPCDVFQVPDELGLIWTCNYSGDIVVRFCVVQSAFPFGNPAIGDAYKLDRPLLYDGTSLYGSGNEITIDAWLDEWVNLPYIFGTPNYTINNLSSTTHTNLVMMSEGLNVPTYSLTRVLPTNLITNGDFSVDSNSDGLADGFNAYLEDTHTIVNGVQNVLFNQNGYFYNIPSISPVQGNLYYAGYTVNNVDTVHFNNMAILVSNAPNGFSSFQQILTVNDNIAIFFYPETLGVISTFDNIKVYNVSALKLAGLFGGMTDSAIKTVLDDYAQNGLTASNIGYFFDGDASWDALTISEKNAVLQYYGLSYAGGTVINFNQTDEKLWAIWNDGSVADFTENVLVYRTVWHNSAYDYQYFFDPFLETDSEINAYIMAIRNPSESGNTSFSVLDTAKYSVYRWRNALTVAQKAYYDGLYWDYKNSVDRWEWYKDYGVNASNFTVLRARYDFLVAHYSNDYPTTSLDNITFTSTRADIVPIDVPTFFEKIDTGITDWGLGDFGYFLIVIVVMVAMAVLMGIFHFPMPIFILFEGLAFITFSIFGWIPLWLVLVLVLGVVILVVKRFIGQGNGGGGDE